MTSLKLEELVGKYCDYDLHVFGPKAFYPVAWPNWKAIFKVRRENPPGMKERQRSHQKISSTFCDQYRVIHLVVDLGWADSSKYLGLTQI